MSDPSSYSQQPLHESLTNREFEVLHLKAARYSNQEIADRLFLSLNTVKWYVRQLYAKLGAKNRQACIKRARELGLLQTTKKDVLSPNLPTEATLAYYFCNYSH
ncbi:MAG: response regulator transcription factor [Anaerolineae bacterium]|nr:response regulator transcription factor [Anaerolineae bacterium]